MHTRAIVIIIVAVILAALAYFLIGANGAALDSAALSATSSSAAAMGKMAAGALDSKRDPKMVGTWKATDDVNATREFKADGTVTDRYAGDASATDTGTWEPVDPTTEVIGVPAESVAGMTVLRLNFEKSGAMFFSVLSVDDSHLELSYLGRGNTLSYVKVQ